MKMKEVNFEELSDLIKRHSQGDTFHTKVEFTLSGNKAVTLEMLEKLFPGSREELIRDIISAGLNAHMDMVAPILMLAKLDAAILKELEDEGEESKG